MLKLDRATRDANRELTQTGTITRLLSGDYTVRLSGASENGAETVVCRARGKLRLERISPLVGDRVEVRGNTVINVLPRKNVFERPPVANLDTLVLITCNVNPVADTFVLDTLIAIAEQKNCEPLIVLNKCDLDTCDELFAAYSGAGFGVLRVSALTGSGLDELATALKGKTCAFAGNSGSGKSSILNALSALDFTGLHIKVGEVSVKLGRGRHTTRHTELFELGGGALVVDTAGFSKLDTDLLELLPNEIADCFREFEPFIGGCRFQDCNHLKEPDCAVIAALQRGEISKSRYVSYERLFAAAKERQRTQYD
jgi:ribosome biogenesis GTPase